MPQESACICEWDGAPARVKATLEPPELILRGEIRKRIPFSRMKNVRAEGGALRFIVDETAVLLWLDSKTAESWAKKFVAPPPSLAKKMGIAAATRIRVIGTVDDEALRGAIAEGTEAGSRDSDLIIARVNTPAELSRALRSAATQLAQGVPIWFVYRKGPGHPLSENDVRSAGLAAGIVDTKIASVSSSLTALRFVKRRTSGPD
jgi:hypothetical protein